MRWIVASLAGCLDELDVEGFIIEAFWGVARLCVFCIGCAAFFASGALSGTHGKGPLPMNFALCPWSCD